MEGQQDDIEETNFPSEVQVGDLQDFLDEDAGEKEPPARKRKKTDSLDDQHNAMNFSINDNTHSQLDYSSRMTFNINGTNNTSRNDRPILSLYNSPQPSPFFFNGSEKGKEKETYDHVIDQDLYILIGNLQEDKIDEALAALALLGVRLDADGLIYDNNTLTIPLLDNAAKERWLQFKTAYDGPGNVINETGQANNTQIFAVVLEGVNGDPGYLTGPKLANAVEDPTMKDILDKASARLLSHTNKDHWLLELSDMTEVREVLLHPNIIYGATYLRASIYVKTEVKNLVIMVFNIPPRYNKDKLVNIVQNLSKVRPTYIDIKLRKNAPRYAFLHCWDEHQKQLLLKKGSVHIAGHTLRFEPRRSEEEKIRLLRKKAQEDAEKKSLLESQLRQQEEHSRQRIKREQVAQERQNSLQAQEREHELLLQQRLAAIQAKLQASQSK